MFQIQFWYNIFSAIILRSGLARVAPTTALGVVLRHFWECMITTGDEEPCIHLSDYLGFCQICESTDPNLRSDKRLRVLQRGFTTPRAPAVVIHSRKCLRTILQWCCGGYTGQTRAQNERTEDVVPEPDFEIRFLKKHAFFGDCEILIW